MSSEIVPSQTTIAKTPQERILASQTIIKTLTATIQDNYMATISGKRYIMVAGAQAIASAMGYTVRVDSCIHKPADGGLSGHWEASASVIDGDTGLVVASGIGHVFDDENPWGKRPRFAQAAMCQTRATGRALKGAVGFMFALVGAQASLAEEMPGEDFQQPKALVDGSVVNAAVAKIESAKTESELREAFASGYSVARDAGDRAAMLRLTEAKDAAKKRIIDGAVMTEPGRSVEGAGGETGTPAAAPTPQAEESEPPIFYESEKPPKGAKWSKTAARVAKVSPARELNNGGEVHTVTLAVGDEPTLIEADCFSRPLVAECSRAYRLVRVVLVLMSKSADGKTTLHGVKEDTNG